MKEAYSYFYRKEKTKVTVPSLALNGVSNGRTLAADLCMGRDSAKACHWGENSGERLLMGGCATRKWMGEKWLLAVGQDLAIYICLSREIRS